MKLPRLWPKFETQIPEKGTQQASKTGYKDFGAAGTETILTIALTNGQVIRITDIAVSGNVAGYGWIEFGAAVIWGRLNFPAKSGWAQQFRGELRVTGDGVNSVLVKIYLSGAGRGDASLLYSLE